MDEIGLYYYVARFYDPVIAHFTQADTLIPEPGMSVAYDRYAYVQWNPIRYNDPMGHYLVEGDWLSPDSGTYSAGYYQYGNTVLLNPEDAALIYGVVTPMRVSWATLIDPDNQFEKYAIGLMLAPEFAARNMPPGFLERGVKGSVPGGLQKDVLGDPDCTGCGYSINPNENKLQWVFRDLRHERIAYGKRGWTEKTITRTLRNPAETKLTIDLATNNPATIYYRSDGHYVVRNNVTGEVIHVSDTNNSGWVDPFNEVIRPRGPRP